MQGRRGRVHRDMASVIRCICRGAWTNTYHVKHTSEPQTTTATTATQCLRMVLVLWVSGCRRVGMVFAVCRGSCAVPFALGVSFCSICPCRGCCCRDAFSQPLPRLLGRGPCFQSPVCCFGCCAISMCGGCPCQGCCACSVVCGLSGGGDRRKRRFCFFLKSE